MHKYIILFTLFLSLISCDVQDDKVKFTNYSKYYLEVFLTKESQSFNEAISCGIIPPDSTYGIGMMNYKWDNYFKKNDVAILYIVELIVKNYKNDHYFDYNYGQTLKIIKVTKEMLDSLGWKIEYP
jgi:hypothetical protein